MEHAVAEPRDPLFGCQERFGREGGLDVSQKPVEINGTEIVGQRAGLLPGRLVVRGDRQGIVADQGTVHLNRSDQAGTVLKFQIELMLFRYCAAGGDKAQADAVGE